MPLYRTAHFRNANLKADLARAKALAHLLHSTEASCFLAHHDADCCSGADGVVCPDAAFPGETVEVGARQRGSDDIVVSGGSSVTLTGGGGGGSPYVMCRFVVFKETVASFDSPKQIAFKQVGPLSLSLALIARHLTTSEPYPLLVLSLRALSLLRRCFRRSQDWRPTTSRWCACMGERGRVLLSSWRFAASQTGASTQ